MLKNIGITRLEVRNAFAHSISVDKSKQQIIISNSPFKRNKNQNYCKQNRGKSLFTRFQCGWMHNSQKNCLQFRFHFNFFYVFSCLLPIWFFFFFFLEIHLFLKQIVCALSSFEKLFFGLEFYLRFALTSKWS